LCGQKDIAAMSHVSKCSSFLRDLWRRQARVAELPAALQPRSKAEAYAVQALMMRESTRPLFGWKIAATSVAGQRHIGVDGPLAGRYISERCLCEGMTVPFGRNHMKSHTLCGKGGV
jgi:2-keto-4-pentenoate hydratase